MFSMVAAVVYTVIGDTVTIIWMVWIISTSVAELVLKTVSRMRLVTAVPKSWVQFLILFTTAHTFLENNYLNSSNNLQSIATADISTSIKFSLDSPQR
jgi:hypothetical protein